jgi:hypothetical protein
MFRAYSIQVSREDEWDFGGLKTKSANALEASLQFKNKWTAKPRLEFQQSVDTRALRGGPALRIHDFWSTTASLETDPSRRTSFTLIGRRTRAVDDNSRLSRVEALARFRLSNRLSLSGQASYETLADNLQYVSTVDRDAGSRWLLGRIEQDTWGLTFRANFSVTPDLTIQYYGSPFLSVGSYTTFKRAADTLAERYQDRFHAFSPDEITFQPDSGRYFVSEGTNAASYSFANPDFSFRQFRSNLVVRWEYKPGSTLYVVWSQGRTGLDPHWDPSFSSNWSALWRERPDNVFMVKLSYWLSP